MIQLATALVRLFPGQGGDDDVHWKGLRLLAGCPEELEQWLRFDVAAPVRPRSSRPRFDVSLAAVGDKKINVIKEVRAITGLGLKETKDLVEGAPKVIKKGASKREASMLTRQLEAAGATVAVAVRTAQRKGERTDRPSVNGAYT